MDEDIKFCEVCYAEYHRRKREARSRFRQRRACSRACGARLGSDTRPLPGPRGNYKPPTPGALYLRLLEDYTDLGLTNTDISDELNLNPETVRSALGRLQEQGIVTFRYGESNEKLWLLSKYQKEAA